MIRNKSYAGLDYFRIIAALLIIAIHTSPLLSYSKMADFVLTSIIARIAVPFFFMLSGFFLISTYNYNCNKLKSFLKNVLFIYGIAIVIYIPLNIYTGYFSMNNLVPNIIKDIVFDGTLYHLWYLPASIIGASIAYFLVKKLGLKYSLVITIVIYVIGMFGDSYYGFLEKIPLLKNLYGYIFEVSDYTRNGIFFAPVFFILGGIISNKSNYMSTKNSLIGFLISFLLMLCE
ncbi:acyltransferase family protein, partial [Clostridioides difficile]